MFYPQNLHTHGPFCDGKTDYEDMIKKAIEIGFTSLGFSGHSHMAFDESYCMSIENTANYKKLIKTLADKYEDKIDIFCGIEFDLLSDDDPTDYDYVIGDVHAIPVNGEYLVVDPSTANDILTDVDKHFGGNLMNWVKAYYENMAQLVNLKKCDIVGHFDLLTKLTQKYDFLDTESKQYREYALEALHHIVKKINIFEINVSSIARGYKSIPYPEPFILKELKALGGNVVITSDCHNADYLGANHDVGIELAKSCGFDEVMILTKDGFKGLKI